MFLGRVVGSVWSTVKWPEASGLKLLLVRPYCLADLAGTGAGSAESGGKTAGAGGGGGNKAAGAGAQPTDDLVVCADRLDAGPGDDVLVAFGHAARVAMAGVLPAGQKPSVPIDAAVVAVVDRVEIDSA